MTVKEFLKKARIAIIVWLAIWASIQFAKSSQSPSYSTRSFQNNDFKKEAFNILNNKCNSCHRKQNPFMIFTEKNMDKRAHKIKKQVFELKRMPKEEGTPLTQDEYQTLSNWIVNL
tara:strand:+ start:179 stop:526 length:348 start_codon:yes stop_codon:yes gene_type:complete